ncbi:MAG: archease [Candidatus Diapherotrites archaeon]|nr:archease [Candidatus Diapherotrites archaeon]
MKALPTVAGPGGTKIAMPKAHTKKIKRHAKTAKGKKVKTKTSAARPVDAPKPPKAPPVKEAPFEYPPFRSLESVAGEAGFEAFGRNEKELLENAALGLFSEMANTPLLLPIKRVVVSLSAQTTEELLHKLLSEIVFLKDLNSIVFKSIELRFWRLKNNTGLEAELAGQGVEELATGVVKTDVKAVTFHDFRIEQIPKGLKATVVLDI